MQLYSQASLKVRKPKLQIDSSNSGRKQLRLAFTKTGQAMSSKDSFGKVVSTIVNP